MWRILLLAVWVTGAVQGPLAAAEKRVALVIGNATYTAPQSGAAARPEPAEGGQLKVTLPPLNNPVNDAQDMAAVLATLGFQVIDGYNLDQTSMRGAIQEFAAAIEDAQVALFYFSGHGMQDGERNFLIPVDARIRGLKDLDLATIELKLVLNQMQRANRLSIVYLDACRDNPVADAIAAMAAPASRRIEVIARGLAGISQAPLGGTYIAFSTQPGNVALDGAGKRNSPFTDSLVRQIVVEGRSLTDTMIAVRNEVVTATNGKQVPFETHSLLSTFFFKPGAAASPTPLLISTGVGETPVASDKNLQVVNAPPDPKAVRINAGRMAFLDCDSNVVCLKKWISDYGDHQMADQALAIIAASIEVPRFQDCSNAGNDNERMRYCFLYLSAFPNGKFTAEANRILQQATAAVGKPIVAPPPPPPPSPVARSFVKHHNMDLYGGDYGGPLKGVSHDNCEYSCSTDMRCVGYTYDRRNSWCFLKAQVIQLTANEKADSGVLEGLDGSVTTGPSERAQRNFTMLDGEDIPGGDYGSTLKNVSRDRCLAACRDDAGCVAFTYDKRNRWCFRKSAVSGRKPSASAISGILSSRSARAPVREAAASGGMQMLSDTDFMGMDFDRAGIRPASLGECQQICLNNPRCKAFSWIRESNWCWPKNGVPRPRNRSGVTSGFRN